MQSFNSSHNLSTTKDEFVATGSGVAFGARRLKSVNDRWASTSSMTALTLDTARRVKEVSEAKQDALLAIEENELAREIHACKKILETLPADAPEREQHLKRMEIARLKLGTDKPASYTKAIKLVSRYASLEEQRLKHIGSSSEHHAVAQMAVCQTESMMDRLPHSFKGKTNFLPERTPEGMSAARRLTELRRHLDERARMLDETRNQNLHSMAETHPILKAIIERLESEELPSDGTLIIMSKKGHYMAPRGSMSPHFIEVSRLRTGGVSADGGGFNRFMQDLEDICGAVIMRPIYDEHGKPLEVPGKPGSKPVYRKTVVDTIGEMPESIKPGVDFLFILRRFKPNH
ncbi:MAG: hypothetical protein J0M35_11225 [Candidatus Obscuribacter phosphatis]|jgi:hypothetical protein|uniref:Uncharacterized protein n=1 Tax=Candidatus Obscuribacter phosphatis TaxID=1906157 RepID=A0A8J7PLM9_9BACT|nr:hypothetical protein [Candidatus Obscuribacter phosphatis]